MKHVPFAHTENVLNSVKPVQLLQRILQLATTPTENDVVMDFFSGSGTTAHAVVQQNAEDNGNRAFIGIQICEALPVPEPTFTSIFGMGLERLKSAGRELCAAPGGSHVDAGFRVLSIDSTNLVDVARTTTETQQGQLDVFVDTIKPDRTGEDLLFQVLLDWGLELSVPIAREVVDDREVFVVDDGALIACFAESVSTAVVQEIATRQPLRAVFRDSGFPDDAARINAEQVFRQRSPHTDVKTI